MAAILGLRYQTRSKALQEGPLGLLPEGTEGPERAALPMHLLLQAQAGMFGMRIHLLHDLNNCE